MEDIMLMLFSVFALAYAGGAALGKGKTFTSLILAMASMYFMVAILGTYIR